MASDTIPKSLRNGAALLFTISNFLSPSLILFSSIKLEVGFG